MPTPIVKKSKTREKLRQELERSLLIEPADQDFWLANVDNMPLAIVRNLLKILSPKNAQVDSYIETALAQDQNGEHLKALQSQIAAIKKQAFQKEENQTAQKEERQSEELLEELNHL